MQNFGQKYQILVKKCWLGASPGPKSGATGGSQIWGHRWPQIWSHRWLPNVDPPVAPKMGPRSPQGAREAWGEGRAGTGARRTSSLLRVRVPRKNSVSREGFSYAVEEAADSPQPHNPPRPPALPLRVDLTPHLCKNGSCHCSR